MRKNQDTPLIARTIRRVRKGVYDIALYHPSGRRYGIWPERFYAKDMAAARAACMRLYPSTVFLPSRRAKETLESHDAEPLL